MKCLNEGSFNMFLLWLTLVLLHQGDTLVPVVTVPLGESVTLSCALLEKYETMSSIHWYKQSFGDTLKLIVMKQTYGTSNNEQNVSDSRIKVTKDNKFSNLTNLKTVLQDEGMYHCAHMEWYKSTWMGTYLSIKGNSGMTSRYNVLQNRNVSDPIDPTDTETLQCSVLSESEDKNCSGELSVFWFRTGSEKSYPDIIHTNDKGLHKCENTSTSNNQRKCSYNFYKNFSSSDTGTFYCALATCGEILFGNGTKTADLSPSSTNDVLRMVIICLAISMTVNIGFICYLTQGSLRRNFKAKHNHNQPDNIAKDGQDLNYASLHFNDGRPSRKKKNQQLKSEESVYSQVKGVI